MEFEIQPQPSGEEREAILAALERLLRGADQRPAYDSRWRRVGVTENVFAKSAAPFRRRESGEPVEFEIEPEPSSEEREAILTALERLLRGTDQPAACDGRWWRAGVAESLRDAVPPGSG